MGSPLTPRQAQIEAVIDRLREEFPDATISLEYENRLQLLIAVILSAQCTDKRVNMVTNSLFEKYPSAEAFAEADQETLAQDIGSITYFNSKARYIRESCATMLEKHDGQVPDTMDELTELPGVGRKTANVVLHHGYDIAEGIVVDTHVRRLSRRLGLTTATTPDSIERDLVELVPKKDWRTITHLLISHGRQTCTAINPACDNCALEDICPSSMVDGEMDLASGELWNA